MADIFFLDTSAFIALDEREPGAEEVEAILAKAWLGQVEVHASFATLVHKDPELDLLKGVLKLQSLPPKAPRSS